MQRGSFYGPGVGPIHLGGLQCNGNEINLTNCNSGSTDGCTHQTDAGVACQPSKFEHNLLVYFCDYGYIITKINYQLFGAIEVVVFYIIRGVKRTLLIFLSPLCLSLPPPPSCSPPSLLLSLPPNLPLPTSPSQPPPPNLPSYLLFFL